MGRAYYSDSIANFLTASPDEIIGKLTTKNEFSLEQSQRDAWLQQIVILQDLLSRHQGAIFFEYSIPRMGRRIDVVLLIGPVIFVLEFKVGDTQFSSSAINQVWDYGLDLKNFHEQSHDNYIAPKMCLYWLSNYWTLRLSERAKLWIKFPKNTLLSSLEIYPRQNNG